MKVNDIIGKELIHNELGKCLVTGKPPKSKKYVHVKCIQRKRGWNEFNGEYERYMVTRPNPEYPGAVTVFFKQHKRDEFGIEDTVHIKTLK